MATSWWPQLFLEGQLQLCFIDEAGDLGVLSNPPLPNDQPVLVVGGLFIDAAVLSDLTDNFIHLKHRYFPNLPYRSTNHLDRILPEIKGADIRRNITRGSAGQRAHAIGFLDRLLGLLRHNDVKLVARIWVKGVGKPFFPTAVYTSSIQGLCTYFDNFLAQENDVGICIADSRNKPKNVSVSHSLFTKKFSLTMPKYHRIVELPTFGHSENHAGIQICDLVCSSLLYPVACFAYCTGYVQNTHVQPNAALLRNRYGKQIKSLQYRYLNQEIKRYEGGVVVSDAIKHRNGSLMFS